MRNEVLSTHEHPSAHEHDLQSTPY
jgi:hypothetical protein